MIETPWKAKNLKAVEATKPIKMAEKKYQGRIMGT